MSLDALDTAVGLDLGRGRPDGIRLVWGGHNDDHTFYCLAWRRFASRERFQHYWLRHLSHLQTRVAAYGRSDPLGIVAWLERQGVLVEWPAPTDRDLEGEMNLWMLPRAYTRAFDMALSANLRIRRDDVISDRWLRLQVLHHALAEITEDLRRLSINFGPPDPVSPSLPPPKTACEDRSLDPDEYDEIPF